MTNNQIDKMGDDNALRKSLQEKNEYFKRMVNLIPAKYYLDKETKKVGERFFKNMKEEAPKQQLKEKSTKSKRKKQRMDPDAKQELQVTDLQDALARKEEERESRRQEKIKQEKEEAEKRQAREEAQDEQDEESSGDEMGGLEGGLQGLGETDDKAPSHSAVVRRVSVERIQSSASIDDLRRKVQEKIQQLRQQRQAKSLAGNAVMSKKMAKKAKEANEKKLRKQEQYEAIKASREQKRKENERRRTQSGDGQEDKNDVPKGEDKVQDKNVVSFSKFDFDENKTSKKSKKKKKRKHGEEKLSGRDYEGLLKKVQAKKQKIAEVKKSNPDAAEEMIKQDLWRAALDRAEGKKVRDDPELLKKSIRKKKEKQKHSKKKWGERETKTKELKEDRQKKRRKNLKVRKDARKAKKVKRLQKKGKLLLKDSDYS